MRWIKKRKRSIYQTTGSTQNVGFNSIITSIYSQKPGKLIVVYNKGGKCIAYLSFSDISSTL